MHVELVQVVGAVMVAPALYLARQLVRAWIEDRRLMRRAQMARSLPPGSAVREQYPDGTGVSIILGKGDRRP